MYNKQFSQNINIQVPIIVTKVVAVTLIQEFGSTT